MCNFCFDIDIEQFEDYQAFEKFDLQLNQKRKLNQNGLVVVDNNGSYLNYYFQILKCNNCNTAWWFSAPENAWRGFFMKETNAKIKLQGHKQNDLKKKIGLIFILLFLLLIVIYSLNN